MAHLVYFEFPTTGPFAADAAEVYADLAADIAAEDALVWKVWTEDTASGTAGGVYLFTDEASAARYVDKHTQRLAGFGVTDITARSFAVNDALSSTTRAVLQRADAR